MISIVLALVTTPAADAAEVAVSPFLGVFLPSAEHELYDPTVGAYTPYAAAGPAFGARATLLPLPFLGAEAEAEIDALGTRGHGAAALLGWRAQAIALVPLDTVQPFVVVGLGDLAAFSPATANGRDVDAAFQWGLGARYALKDGRYLRADLRDHVTSRHGIADKPAHHLGIQVSAMFAFGGAPKVVDTDLDGLLDDVDACPTVAETVNAYLDADGCADRLANVQVTVVSEDGKPVPDAALTVGGVAVPLDASGKATQNDQTPGVAWSATATHPSFAPARLDGVTLAEGDNAWTVRMAWLPSTLTVSAKGEKGAPIDARVTLTGPATPPEVATGADGTESLTLPHGDWRVLVSAAGHGTERREIHLDPGQGGAVDVTLRPAKAEVRITSIVALEKVQFEFDSDRILAASEPLLVEVANTLMQHPELKRVEVAGHTDDKGDDAYNLELSQKRVDAVVAFLVRQGVDASRLTAKGYGETKPRVPNNSEANRAENRRVEFLILDPKPSAP